MKRPSRAEALKGRRVERLQGMPGARGRREEEEGAAPQSLVGGQDNTHPLDSGGTGRLRRSQRWCLDAQVSVSACVVIRGGGGGEGPKLSATLLGHDERRAKDAIREA